MGDMRESPPPHCNNKCPFWEKCADGAKKVEAPARIVEHCCCLMAYVAVNAWSKRLKYAANLPAQLRNVVNIVLGSAHWLETGHGRKELRDIDHLVHTFVPLAVFASWLQLKCARPLRYLGGTTLVAGGLWQLYQTRDPNVPTELAHDLLETPIAKWLPETLQAAIGIGSGLRLLFAAEEA